METTVIEDEMQDEGRPGEDGLDEGDDGAMGWEISAREAVVALLAEATWDLVGKTVTLPEEQRDGEIRPVTYRDEAGFVARLEEAYVTAWQGEVPWDEGAAVFEDDASNEAPDLLAPYEDRLVAMGWR